MDSIKACNNVQTNVLNTVALKVEYVKVFRFIMPYAGLLTHITTLEVYLISD